MWVYPDDRLHHAGDLHLLRHQLAAVILLNDRRKEMKRYGWIVLVVLGLALTSCVLPVRYTTVRGTGNVITESRRVSGFDSVDLSGIGTLIIEQGDSESLEITAEDNLMPYLESRVIGSRLELGVQQFVSIQPMKDIVYHLTVIDLSAIDTSGLGNVEINSLSTAQLSIDISGSGNVNIGDLQAETLNLNVSGMGNITVAGKVNDQRVEISGAGSYQAGDMQSSTARIKISGSGNATVWAEQDLNVDISGMGTVDYFGSPVVSSDISGAGNLSSAGAK